VLIYLGYLTGSWVEGDGWCLGTFYSLVGSFKLIFALLIFCSEMS